MSTFGTRLLHWPDQPSTALLVTTTAIASVTLLCLGRSWGWPLRRKVLDNPLKSVPRTAKGRDELDSLIYRPDTFPGARDVDTPYGSIRVYEFGPQDGPKVLFVHGISTSCVTLMHLANALVKKGCRVMLFDLFGRGFTDGVGDLPHDERLYITQILLVLASSPLPWTGDNAFRLIGYSLGGGIAVHFANTFPNLVASLVLLAPAGLIRPETFGLLSRILFSSGVVPETIVAHLTKRRLQQPIAAAKVPKHAVPVDPRIDIMRAEAADSTEEKLIPLEKHVLVYVRWMVVHHFGFVPAFMSCIRHADRMLTSQHGAWDKLKNREPGTTAVLLAKGDEIIDLEHYEQVGLPLLGDNDHTMWRVLPGAHDFVMTHPQHIVEALDELWGYT